MRLSIEDAARTLRYEFLLHSALSLGANRVAVGHTADDQAETILMRLIRGTGPHGLEGIPPTRALGDADGPVIIRPLINSWRDDIMRHVRSRKLKYRRDASNESPEYTRNRIRLELLPQLKKEYNPQIKQRLVSAASALAVENDFIAAEAGLLADEITIEKKAGQVVFDAVLLSALHSALRKRILFNLVRSVKANAPMLEAVHYDEAESILGAARGKLDLPGRLRLEISEGIGLISEPARAATVPRGNFSISLGGETIIPELGLAVRTKILQSVSSPAHLIRRCTQNRQYFDLDTVRLPLEIRLRRRGDSFRPLGGRGTKKLKDFFIDKKVPRFLRDHVPLLLSNNRIMWIMGHAIDRRYLLTSRSTAALRVDYERRSP
jgi:tRNA(Ile)-lysidine synthase